jgi:enterochelin esterase-like enzyme
MEIRDRLPFDDGTFRELTVYLPRIPTTEVRYILCADGQSLPYLIGSQERSGATSRTAFIGVHSSNSLRAREYVEGRDNQHFHRHERFFVNDVRCWVERRFGVELCPNNTGCFGYSCGGSFAVSMGIRHPNIFGSVIALSVANRPIRVDQPTQELLDLSRMWLYLAAGESEPGGMKKYMERLSVWQRKHGGQSRCLPSPGGHEVAVWKHELLRGIEWLRDSCPVR